MALLQQLNLTFEQLLEQNGYSPERIQRQKFEIIRYRSQDRSRSAARLRELGLEQKAFSIDDFKQMQHVPFSSDLDIETFLRSSQLGFRDLQVRIPDLHVPRLLFDKNPVAAPQGAGVSSQKQMVQSVGNVSPFEIMIENGIPEETAYALAKEYNAQPISKPSIKVFQAFLVQKKIDFTAWNFDILPVKCLSFDRCSSEIKDKVCIFLNHQKEADQFLAIFLNNHYYQTFVHVAFDDTETILGVVATLTVYGEKQSLKKISNSLSLAQVNRILVLLSQRQSQGQIKADKHLFFQKATTAVARDAEPVEENWATLD